MFAVGCPELTCGSGELARCQAEGDHVVPGMAPRREYSRMSSSPAHRRVAYMSRPKAPEIQQMYSLNMPVSALRTRVRQEFERHRFVQQLPVVDMLIFQSHTEYQVRASMSTLRGGVATSTRILCCCYRISDDVRACRERYSTSLALD